MDRFAEWLWQRSAGHVRRTFTGALVIWIAVFYGPPILFIFGSFFGLAPALVQVGLQTLVNVLIALVIAARLPNWELYDRWSTGDHRDPARLLEATFETRRSLERQVWAFPLVYVVVLVPSATVLFDLEPIGVVAMAVSHLMTPLLGLIAVAGTLDLAFRPARIEASALLGTGAKVGRGTSLEVRVTGLGLALAYVMGFQAAAFAVMFEGQSSSFAAATLGLSVSMTFFGVTYFLLLAVRPLLRPTTDLTAAVQRIDAGDYHSAVPVISDDELGVLAGAVNSMQRGLAERERLQAAFGSYVDPALAARLLEQGDELFRGERRDVTVMFVDIRDFTPFAEANTAEDTVTRLNTVFEIVVEVVADHHGHVNKFLGDGAMAVFGAPNTLSDHADQALAAAADISARIVGRFGESLRIGVGINTGPVVAGTIGGAGKLEYTLIGDAVNVAARVEQLTKTTGDTVLVTQQTVDALQDPPAAFVHRGAHELKGKSAPVTLHALTISGTVPER